MDLAFLDIWWVDAIIGFFVAAFTLWAIPNKVWAKLMSFFGATLVPILNKVGGLSDTAAVMARSAGFDKLGNVLEKLGDTADELEDPLTLLEEYTKDGKLDSAELKSVINEIGEGAVSVKDLVGSVIALIKKKE